MKKPKKQLPRFPKILADELDVALANTHELGPDKTMELLSKYRRNRAKRIATWGILDIGAPVDDLEPIPQEYAWQIEQLDQAFQKMHRYRSGGAGDYVAADVEREINRRRATQTRIRSTNHDEIGDYLRRRGYSASSNKKSLVVDAMEHFGVSESVVRRAIRYSGLGRNRVLSGSG